jgi:hypothetical protein
MAFATTGHLWWMAAFTLVIVAERSVKYIRQRPHILAPVGVLGLAVAIVVGGPGEAADAVSWFCSLPSG